MTKSHERGENGITVEAKRRASREGKDVCSILKEMLAQAKVQGDTERVRKIIRAEKYLGCRNVRKRRAT
jgi:hypothetical protein